MKKNQAPISITAKEKKPKPNFWKIGFFIELVLILFIIVIGTVFLFKYQKIQSQLNKLTTKVKNYEQEVNEFRTNKIEVQNQSLCKIEPYRSICKWSGSSGFPIEPKTIGDYTVAIGDMIVGENLNIKVGVRNDGEKIKKISLDNFSILDKDGNQGKIVAAHKSPAFSSNEEELFPEQEIQGYITFKVKNPSASFELKFQPNEEEATPIIFKLSTVLPTT